MSILFQKRGVYGLVGLILTIIFVIIAVGVIWLIVNSTINKTKGELVLERFNLDLKIEEVNLADNNSINITIKRESGEGEITKLIFAVYDGKNSEIFIENSSITNFNSENFVLKLTILNLNDIKEVKVSPILKLKSGKEVQGAIQEEYEINW